MPFRLLVVAALLSLVAAGCGNKDGEATVADTEGLYLDIGGLKYQVQLSRYINAADVEDRGYLVGLPESTAAPAEDETWFGVWVRVQNESDEPRPAADTWEIHDTQENIFRPIPVDTDINPWVYEAGTIAPNTVWPLPDSAAGQGPTQGQLLLFKVKTESLQNRPLELRFSSGPQGEVGTYDLDV
jgi:hypothetical protein